jgi:malonate transporter
MSPIAEVIAFVFGLIALGYLAGLSGYLRVEHGDAMADFCVAVAVPLLLFRTMANADFGQAAPLMLWATYFSAVAVAWTAGHFVTTRLFGRESRVGIVGGVASAFSNLVLLGIPFFLGAFGQEGFAVLSLLVSIHLPIMTGVSMLLFELSSRGTAVRPAAVLGALLRNLAKNPLIVGILAGLLWRLTTLPLPGLATRLVDALANVAGPVALFAIGLNLLRFGLSGNVRNALGVTAVKLFLMPAVALLFAKLLGLPPLTAKVAVMAAALPSGVNPFLIATQFGVGQALSSNATTVATACSVLTIAFWLAVVQAVF